MRPKPKKDRQPAILPPRVEKTSVLKPRGASGSREKKGRHSSQLRDRGQAVAGGRRAAQQVWTPPEGKKGDQFHTPFRVMRVLVEMLATYKGRAYGPRCGSGEKGYAAYLR